MALTQEAKQQWEATLREGELMNVDDCIEAHVQGDYWEFLGGQTRGNFFFTKEKFIFVSGLGVTNFSINYTDIRELKKTFVGPFIPTGIKVSAMNPEKGKIKSYKCSVMKRNDWIALLAEKSGVTLA